MTTKRHIKLNKLVRDKIPELLRSQGVTVSSRIMGQDEYINRLKDKLIEESQELLESRNIEEVKEELADLLEVMISLCQAYEISFDDIEAARRQKNLVKGGFRDKLYGEYIEMDSDNELIGYYTNQAHKYPAVKISPNNHIHVLSRAVIIDEDHILLCKTLDLKNNFYFLPGGHVEHGESIEKAMIRELLEESGAICTIIRFLGCLEYNFELGYTTICHNHEYNFIFEALSDALKTNKPIPQLEKHIKLEWLPLSQIAKIDLRPEPLNSLIPRWLEPGSINNRFHSQMIRASSYSSAHDQ